ncbi:TIGR01212 family radical SAM protein, partial [Streptococcus pyogenes]
NLIHIYEEALSHPQVKGIVVGTRPDCVSNELLDYFAYLNKSYYVMIEYGIESTDDKTLAFINRGHDYASAVEAVTKTA